MTDETIRLGDRYELGGLLGRGGMADVRIGQDLRLGRTVAIKQLRPDLSSDDTFQARFRREAQSAAALNHPAIVAVYDTGDATDVHGNHIPYIVMEYVEGQTLREILNDDRKILPERALAITADVLSALDYSHRSGIIHRDIKPANIMLTPAGQVKVMDFGIARAIADSSSAMTATAAVIGTAQYLSPEQARGETVDARSDIYSTGCVLYELLTGRPPFVGESPVSVAYQHVREEARPPSQLNPDVTSTVDNIVAKALAKRTDDRYQSAADMRHDIERAIAGQQVDAPAQATQLGGTAVGMGALAGLGGGLGDTQTGTPTGTHVAARPDEEEPPEDTSRKWWAYAILGVLLLGALAFAIYQLTQPDDVTQVQVTDVVGQDFETAKRALENDGFTVADPIEKTDADVPEGEVISQNPEAGQEADKGSEVELTVSSGPDQVTIPQLTGFSYQEAKQLLESDKYGLKVKKNEQESSAPENEVINSNPPGGTAVDKGTTVTLLVSQGQSTVPNVVGMDVDDAENALEDAGLKASTDEEPSDTVPEGQVIAQSVPQGQQRPRGSTIDLTVSSGPESSDEDGGFIDGGGTEGENP
jgi:serine/threonine-protein kinase